MRPSGQIWLAAFAAVVGCGPASGTIGGGVVVGDDDDLADDDDGSDDDDDATEVPESPPPLCRVDLLCGQPIPDEPKIPCSIVIEDGHGELQYEGPVGVEKRGRSSQAFPKPQYGVELWVGPAEDASANLLGMGRDSDWILNGAWIDRALFRNKLAYDLFQSFGGPERFAPESAFCELTLDDEWRGIYFLSERVKRDDDRVDILEAGEGGASFIVKQDDTPSLRPIGMAHGHWKLVYPRPSSATPGQLAGVEARLAAWEASVLGPDPGDPDLGVFSYVDIDSAVDFVLLEEFGKNVDGYYLSLHVWQDVGGLIHFTPWDLDLTLGQPNYGNNEPPQGWMNYRPPMIQAMADQPEFKARLVSRWSELRSGVLREEEILGRIDGYRETLGETVYDNFEVWPIDAIQFLDNTLYSVSSYDEEYARVRAWIRDRLEWVDANIADY